MSTEDDEKIDCTVCGRSIDRTGYLAHLVDHVSKEAQERFDVDINSDDVSQIHDMILSEYSDLIHFDLEHILEIFKKSRLVEVLRYDPLSVVLYHSVATGYSIVLDDGGMATLTRVEDRALAVEEMIDKINDIISQSLTDNYYAVQVIGKPSGTCHWFSHHVKVPNSWLGFPVEIQKRGEGPVHRAIPVRCGNSVHVTVPPDWADSTVTVTLAILEDEKDIGGGETNVQGLFA